MSAFDDLDQTAADCRALYNKAVADNLTLYADNVAKATEIERLEAEIERLLADPQPPAARRMLIGANTTSIPNCVEPSMITRIFEDTQFARVTAQTGNGAKWGDNVGRRAIHISFKDTTPSQSRIDSFLDSVPAAQMQPGLYLYVTNHHEQERGDKGFTPAQVRATQSATCRMVLDWMARHPQCPNVAPCIVNMGWYERDTTPATSTADYWPTDIDLGRVVLGLDPYDPNGRREIAELVGPTRDLWTASGGRRLIVAEVNTKRAGAAGADWWTRTWEWLETEGFEASQTFIHETAGKDAPWRLDIPAGVAHAAAISDRT